jgi:hypothetical protein
VEWLKVKALSSSLSTAKKKERMNENQDIAITVITKNKFVGSCSRTKRK